MVPGQDRHIAIPQGELLSPAAEFEAQAGGLDPGAGRLPQKGKDVGEILKNLDLLLCYRRLQKFSHPQVRTANPSSVHQGVYLPKSVWLLAEVVLPDGSINENGQRELALCFGDHGSRIALLRPSAMGDKAFEGFDLLPLDKFMDRLGDGLGFILCGDDLHEVIHQIPGQGNRRPFHENLRH